MRDALCVCFYEWILKYLLLLVLPEPAIEQSQIVQAHGHVDLSHVNLLTLIHACLSRVTIMPTSKDQAL